MRYSRLHTEGSRASEISKYDFVYLCSRAFTFKKVLSGNMTWRGGMGAGGRWS
jgi:hypothetical protein